LLLTQKDIKILWFSILSKNTTQSRFNRGWLYNLFCNLKTVEATETMYLMVKMFLRHLNTEDTNGNVIMEMKIKNAALRLGFKFEGVFRQAAVVKGRNRDTAWFSVIDKEWKKLKKVI